MWNELFSQICIRSHIVLLRLILYQFIAIYYDSLTNEYYFYNGSMKVSTKHL
jgi:hypothetical protein